LGEVLPVVNEANLIARELKRNVLFSTKMIRVMPEFGTLADSKTEVVIKIDNNEDKYYYQWDCDKFMNRVEMIRELLNNFFDNGELPDFNNKDNDPFWDPPEPLLIGTSYLTLKSLGFTIENELHAKILSSEGKQGTRGMVKLSFTPCDKEGDPDNIDDDLLVEEDPKELLGKEICFEVHIGEASDLPKELCKDVFVTYQFKHEPGVIYSTDKYQGMCQNPDFDYKKIHTVEMVTEYVLEYFDTGSVSHPIPFFTLLCFALNFCLLDSLQGVRVPRLQDQQDYRQA
jgi:hypothetical protein